MDDLIIVRGGGDLATAVIHRLWSAGFIVMALETDKPSSIRRHVAASEAVYRGSQTVEGMTARLAADAAEAEKIIEYGDVPVVKDPGGRYIRIMEPEIVVDGIIAKRNTGTTIDMAPLTIALGPGFTAGVDADYVIETMRGHDLGRMISEGSALPDTGVPGNIGGYMKERVMHAEHEGILRSVHKIGDHVAAGDVIAVIETAEGEKALNASITGVIRGIIHDGYEVKPGLKVADIDPREDSYKNCFTISDKARCISGSVLELVCRHMRGRDRGI